MLVPGLPLTPNAEDEDNIDVRHVAIQLHIAPRRVPDDQFTLAVTVREAINRLDSDDSSGGWKMNAVERAFLDKIRQVPPLRIAQVADFVDFLTDREDEQRFTHETGKASEASFVVVWDNDEDAAYDRL